MNKDKIIDYIYGELSPSERSEFEFEMTRNEALRIEVNELLDSRSLVSEGLDYLPPVENPVDKPQKFKKMHLSKWWAIAASILMLVFIGYLSGLRMGIHEKSLVLGFNEIKSPKNELVNQDYLSKEEFYAAVSKLEDKIIPQQKPIQKESLNKEEIGQMIEVAMRNLDKKYKSWATETLMANQYETRNQTETLMQEFLDFYEIKRAEDIKQINEGLTNLALMVQENNDGLPQYAYQPVQ